MSRQIILNSSSILVFLYDSHRYCNCEFLNKSSVNLDGYSSANAYPFKYIPSSYSSLYNIPSDGMGSGL